ncbi:MAG: cellulase family glycosylhydrolase [Clostridia bacterium]|nr:cellulase family glycosylhydrolase [Clostridia bacterium]
MNLFKKITALFAAVCLALPGSAVCLASETEYAITSSLNGGWHNDHIGRTLAAAGTFGSSPVFSGLTARVGDDPEAVSVSRLLGREGWVITPNKGEKARYINIDIDKSVAYNVTDGQSFAVEVDYYDDNAMSSLACEYHSMDYQPLVKTESSGETSQPQLNIDPAVGEGEYLVFNGTGMWKTYTWFLPNPKFADGLDDFDLRIGIYSDTMKYSRGGEVMISAVRIYRLDTKSRVEISHVTGENLGNIFFEGDEIELSTKFSSCIYPHFSQIDGSYPLDIKYTARNEDGDIVAEGSDSFTLSPLSEAERKWKLRVDRFGIYRVDIEAVCGEKKIYSHMGTEFSYVRSDKGKTVNPKAGIQIALTNPEDERISRLTRYAGVPNVRMMLYYYNYRKSAEQYEITNTAVPESHKSLFRAFKKAGLEIDANLHSASWMGAAYNFSPIERTPPYTEAGLRRWADYCARMALLFGDTVDQFEIWNEYNLGPNHSFNMENRPAADYGKMYEVSKKAIKEVNPDIPVIGFNTSGAAASWISQVLDTGLRDVDVISIHPYQWYGDPITYNTVELGINPLLDVLEKYGMSDIPIWITEYGYSSHYEDVNSDLEQGLYNAQAYAMIMATEKIDRYYFYCLLDKDNNIRADRETNFGMIRDRINNPIPYMVPYGAKPGYLMLSQLNLMYHDAEYMDTIKLGETGRVIRSRHKTDGSQFAMLFSNREGGELVTLNLGTDKIKVYDAYGNSSEVYGSNGVFSFDLSKRLIYIEGCFNSFERVIGGVYPGRTDIDAVCGEDAEIPVMNYSGKSVFVKAEPMCGSELKGGEARIDGESGTVMLGGVSSVSGTERVRLTVTDGTSTLFCGFVYVNYHPRAMLRTTLLPTSDGWSMRCTVTNLSEKSEVSGRLTLLTPYEWREKAPDRQISLKPGETETVDIELPVAPAADDHVIEMGFVTDESSGMGSYVSRTYNFSAAQKAEGPIVIDARGDEWTEGFMTMTRSDQFMSLLSLGSTYAGPDDLSVSAAVKWDEDNFYFYADVVDNKHFSTGVKDVNIWQMDSIQLALVYDPLSELERSEFEEIAIGELDSRPVLYRHKTRFKGDGDYTKVEGSELAVRVDGVHTYYELKMPWSSLMTEKVDIQPGTELKFAMIVNENDGVGRVGYMAFGDGIAATKNSSLFKRLYIRGEIQK